MILKNYKTQNCGGIFVMYSAIHSLPNAAQAGNEASGVVCFDVCM